MKQNHLYDVLIIGSGVAGLTLALQLDKNLRIALFSKASLQAGASWLAQGGMPPCSMKMTVPTPISRTHWWLVPGYVMRTQCVLSWKMAQMQSAG